MNGRHRGVSSPVSYALVIAITLALTAGLLFGAETLIEQNREETADRQVDSVTEQLASTLVHADQLAATEPDPDRLSITRRFPSRVAGSQYRVETLNTSQNGDPPFRATITVEAVDFGTTVQTNVSTRLPVGNTTINGGTLRLAYNRSMDGLEVKNA